MVDLYYYDHRLYRLCTYAQRIIIIVAIKLTCEVAGSREAPEFDCSSPSSRTIEGSVELVEYE